jgi:tRNA-dihydrouridine synthase C
MAAYQPPVFWAQIGKVRSALAGVPLVANGDIWTFEDFLKCRDDTGCEHFMMGRGALADPDLVHRGARELGLSADSPRELGLSARESTPLTREAWAPLVDRFIEISLEYFPVRSAVLSRCKQWIRMAHRHRGLEWFDEVKRLETLEELQHYLHGTSGAFSRTPDLDGEQLS